MQMPWQLFTMLLIIAGLCTYRMLGRADRNNYTELIAGLFATVLWIVAGFTMLGGILAEQITYTNIPIGWLLFAVAIINTLLLIPLILDALNNKNNYRETGFGPIRL